MSHIVIAARRPKFAGAEELRRPLSSAALRPRGSFASVARLLLLLLALALPTAPSIAADDPADPAFWYSTAPDGSPRIKLYFYWTSRCEHCRAARPFLAELPSKLPYVELVSRQTDGNAANGRLQFATASALGADPVSVPAMFFCGEAQVGFDSAAGVGAALVRRIEACHSRLVADPALLTRAVKVVPKDLRATGGDGRGSVAALVLAVAFVALVVVGVVLSRRSAAAKQRAIAAKKGGSPKRRKR